MHVLNKTVFVHFMVYTFEKCIKFTNVFLNVKEKYSIVLAFIEHGFISFIWIQFKNE